MKLSPSLARLIGSLNQGDSDLDKKIIILSASQMTDLEIQNIKSIYFPHEEGECVVQIDPSLYGGFIVKKGSKIIDLSIKSYLHTLRSILYESI